MSIRPDSMLQTDDATYPLSSRVTPGVSVIPSRENRNDRLSKDDDEITLVASPALKIPASKKWGLVYSRKRFKTSHGIVSGVDKGKAPSVKEESTRGIEMFDLVSDDSEGIVPGTHVIYDDSVGSVGYRVGSLEDRVLTLEEIEEISHQDRGKIDERMSTLEERVPVVEARTSMTEARIGALEARVGMLEQMVVVVQETSQYHHQHLDDFSMALDIIIDMLEHILYGGGGGGAI
jgi:hypothetical protein